MTDEAAAVRPPHLDDDAAWEDPPRRSPSGTAPVLSVAGFEGPIDFLVQQSRAGRIDLARLSIVELVEAFADALAAVLDGQDKRPVTLLRWGSWLVMAADLAQLRSQLLLPASDPETRSADAEAESLRNQVWQRAGITAAADWLERQHQLGRDVWGRGHAEGGLRRDGRTGDVTGLMRACLVALRVPDGAETAFRVALPFWSPADAVGRIRSMLEDMGEGEAALEAFLPEVAAGLPDRELRCRAAMAGTFAAGLELARQEAVTLTQTQPLDSTIMVATRRGISAPPSVASS